jgi:hypothetical protein
LTSDILDLKPVGECPIAKMMTEVVQRFVGLSIPEAILHGCKARGTMSMTQIVREIGWHEEDCILNMNS